MASPRTCPHCGLRMTTTEVWKQLWRGWRIVCPGCDAALEVPVRARVVSSLCAIVVPGLLSSAVMLTAFPGVDRGAGIWLHLALFAVFGVAGSLLAVHRLRLG